MTIKNKYRIIVSVYSTLPLIVVGAYGIKTRIFPDHHFQASLCLGMGLAVFLGFVAHLLPGIKWLVMGQLTVISALCKEIKKGNYIFFSLRNPPTDHDEENELNHLMRDMNWMIRQIRNREGDLEKKVEIRTRELATMVDELKVAKAAAVASDKAKSEFLANMSHEIRTPMNGIIGMVCLLKKTSVDDLQKDYLETISSSTHSLLRIINDILDFSKAAAEKMTLESIPFSMVRSIEEVVALFQENANRKNLALVTDIPPDLSSYHQGDPFRLKQVIGNLLSNALKFTEKGEISIVVDLKRTETAQNGESYDEMLISVRDTGIGIPAEMQKRIFQSFSQADGSTTRKYGGTGLGLAICRQLVRLMGGQIWVESDTKRGSTFCFTVKLAVLPENCCDLNISDDGLVRDMDTVHHNQQSILAGENDRKKEHPDWAAMAEHLDACAGLIAAHQIAAKRYVVAHLAPLKETDLSPAVDALEKETRRFDFERAAETLVALQDRVKVLQTGGVAGDQMELDGRELNVNGKDGDTDEKQGTHCR